MSDTKLMSFKHSTWLYVIRVTHKPTANTHSATVLNS